ncbi:MAG: hypothetical protein KBF41_15180, partial [Azonexus sp.]|nr:hypothetical protein [Azonexus sp.]
QATTSQRTAYRRLNRTGQFDMQARQTPRQHSDYHLLRTHDPPTLDDLPKATSLLLILRVNIYLQPVE